jgi:hypothetical protein
MYRSVQNLATLKYGVGVRVLIAASALVLSWAPLVILCLLVNTSDTSRWLELASMQQSCNYNQCLSKLFVHNNKENCGICAALDKP